MTLDQLIVKILKNHLCCSSLENYDIEIEPLTQKNSKTFSRTPRCNLIYELTLLKNNILAIRATSETKNNLSDQNCLKEPYNSNFIDIRTIDFFEKINRKTESKINVLTISKKTDKNKKFNIILDIKKITTQLSTTPFAEKYLIECKLNKNIEICPSELRKNLIDSYRDNKSMPCREDSAYKKIESFKSHELTYKIFYEMAMRNVNAKKILHALNYLYDIKTMQKNKIKIDEIDCRIEDNERVYAITGEVNTVDIDDPKMFISLKNYLFQCVASIDNDRFEVEITADKEASDLDLYFDIKPAKYQDDKISLALPVANSTVTIRSTTAGVSKKNKKTTMSVKIEKMKYSIDTNDDGSWLLCISDSQKVMLLQKYHNFLKPEEHQIYFSLGIYFINELMSKLEKELIEEYLIYPEYYVVRYYEESRILINKSLNNAVDIQKLQNDSTHRHEEKYFAKEDEYDGYSIHQGVLKNSNNEYDINTIRHDSTRRVVDYNMSNLQLNLNLPKDELLYYLSKIKDNYDNDNSIVMSPLELLGEELGIESENIKNMKPMEWADAFYIYDYFKSNKNDNLTRKKNNIQESLNSYYYISTDKASEVDYKDIQNIAKRFSKVNYSQHHLGIETITSRIQLMEKLIDKEKYKILTTKSKITEE